jgi:CheY-like chemotaxis protein
MAKNPYDRDRDLRGLFLHSAREILQEPDTRLDLRKVAEWAAKSRTAPYLAFGKTEEGGGLAALRLAVAGEGFGELAGRMERALEVAPDPERGLHGLAAAYLAFARDEPRLFRLMFGAHVARALDEPAPPGPGRREQVGLEEARTRMEGAFLQAIQAERGGYLRRDDSLSEEELSGAVWALVHGVAMLAIDEQWKTARLGGLSDPDALAARTLRFLTTATSSTMGPAEHALDQAMRERLSVDGRNSPALRRARALTHLAQGARILWIDDAPGLTAGEARVFSSLGAWIVRARTTEEALARLGRGPVFDVIISDIARGHIHDEGIQALPRVRRAAPDTRVIFYVARLRPDLPPPPGSFGITNSPEELVHLVFDVLERRRV